MHHAEKQRVERGRGIGQMSSLMCVQACWIWGWSIELATLAAFILIRMGARKAKELRQVIHEERYLVGRQINNLIPWTQPPAAAVVERQQGS